MSQEAPSARRRWRSRSQVRCGDRDRVVILDYVRPAAILASTVAIRHMAQMRTVAAGLVLALASFCLNVLSMNVFVGGALVVGLTAAAGRGLPADERSVILIICGVLNGFALLFGLVGKILCLWTPSRSKAA